MRLAGTVLGVVVALGFGQALLGGSDAGTAGPSLEETVRSVVKRVAPSVVRIEVERDDPSRDDPRRRIFGAPEALRRGDDGSGVVLREDGLVLTHRSLVLARGARVIVATGTGRRLRAQVLAEDREIDVALLKVETGDEPLKAIALGTAEGLGPGRLVLALGNPFGVARDARAAASLGIVEAVTRLDARELVPQEAVIVTDAAVNPGNEGGPLVDLDGRMVGMLLPLVRDARCDTLKGVALPTDVIVPRLERLARGGAPGRLGLLFDRNERDPRGLRVVRVVPGSPAERAGLREGDRLARVEGETCDGVAAFARIVERQRAGTLIAVGIERDGKKLEVLVRLGEAP